VPAQSRGVLQQPGAGVRDHLLVRGDHRFSCPQRSTNPILGRRSPADQFHHDVHVVAERFTNIVGPAHSWINPVDALAVDRSVDDNGELQFRRRQLVQEPRDRSADGAKSRDRHPHRAHAFRHAGHGTVSISHNFL
jgi:hypothetical protein